MLLSARSVGVGEADGAHAVHVYQYQRQGVCLLPPAACRRRLLEPTLLLHHCARWPLASGLILLPLCLMNCAFDLRLERLRCDAACVDEHSTLPYEYFIRAKTQSEPPRAASV